MHWLSKSLDIPVITKRDGALAGYAKYAYFDKTRKIFAYFLTKRQNGEDALLPIASAPFADAILLDDPAALLPYDAAAVTDMTRDLLGMDVFSLSGDFKGKVTDAQFTNAGKLAKLVVGRMEVSPSVIACVGDVILLKTAKQSSQKQSESGKIPRPKTDYPVRVLSDASETLARGDFSGTHAKNDALSPAAIVSAPQAISFGKSEPMFSQGALNLVLEGGAPLPYSGDAHTPTRIICDYEFLLGRTLGADLKTYAGELLAPKGAEISAAIVELARAHGKLVDLTLNSVKQKSGEQGRS